MNEGMLERGSIHQTQVQHSKKNVKRNMGSQSFMEKAQQLNDLPMQTHCSDNDEVFLLLYFLFSRAEKDK